MRPTKDENFMGVARLMAERSTCSRRKVGAIIVDANDYILSTGYNGVPHGYPHCTETPCPGANLASGEGLDKCMAIHAEQNAMLHCRALEDAYAIYTTAAPCIHCMKLLLATPIQVIVAGSKYPNPLIETWIKLGRTLRYEEG